MNLATTIVRDSDATPSLMFYEDPLDEDDASDVAVLATRRSLTRLALVAAETGARFQREGLDCDPMTWMLAPRRMFKGQSAIQACLDRAPCVRALILHSLSIGLDAEPEDLDELFDASEPEEEGATAPAELPQVDDFVREAMAIQDWSGSRHLFTAALIHECGGSTLQAFHASVAEDAAEIRAKLVSRFGPSAAHADIVAGFDSTTTFVEAMLSPAIVDILDHVNADPRGSLASGLDINFEQRFAT